MGLVDPPPFMGQSDRRLFRRANSLIERHGRYTTRDLEQVQHHLKSIDESIVLLIDRPEDFVRYGEVLFSLGNLLLSIGSVDVRSDYDLYFRSGEEYLVTIPLRGSGWASTGSMHVEYSRDDIMIVGPLCYVHKHWDGPGETLTVHIPAERFDAALAKRNTRTLLTMPIQRIGRRRLQTFLRVVDMICCDLHGSPGPSPFLREPLAEQIEDVLLSLLLAELPAETGVRRDVAGSPAIPYYVRRAENFIAANAHREIGIDDVAAASGVSLRTIQYGFRKFRETTPMLHLKRIRYERARMLLMSGTTGKICDVAAEVGYTNVSQFSRDYRSFFGESPSQTMAMPRRLVA